MPQNHSANGRQLEVEIHTSQGGDVATLELRGTLSVSLTSDQRESIYAELRNAKQVIVDFEKLTGVTGPGLRGLLTLSRSVRALGKTISGCNVSPELQAIAEASGFWDILQKSEATSFPLPEFVPDLQTDNYPTHHYQGLDLRIGTPLPLGATVTPRGVNFSVYSRNATQATLVLYAPGADRPTVEIPIPDEFRVGDVYAIKIFDLHMDDFEYGFRLDGPMDPAQGHRFDATRVLVDPMAQAIVWRPSSTSDNEQKRIPRSRLIASDFDWGDDRPLELPVEDLVIYEMHLKGFTRHDSSGARFPGTYDAVKEKIPHLKKLGVNCVELLPIFEFDEHEFDRRDPETGRPLVNYWGYSTLGFFAPKSSYAATGEYHLQCDELKSLIKALHAAGIEVLLDVVFNHTAEGNENGPTLSFRGLDNATYYMLDPHGNYYNFSGCGNTLNCNHPVVRDFVVQALRCWVVEYHVDGFRFDLASILGRSTDGTPLINPPLLESLALDPVLGRTRLIAEAWDAGGLYQVGQFPAYNRWGEWNGKYRDCLRRFLKGDAGVVGEMAQRIAGSPDLYRDRGPTTSINFITCHDGFTLMDLVSYNHKHNEANGEGNRDGSNDNLSWNCGVEGPTTDVSVLRLRGQQIRNALAMLFVSQGVPMLLMGDEMGRTQLGNNNTYCQDNELNWLDWTLREENGDLLRFCQSLIAFRKAHPALRQRDFAGTHSRQEALASFDLDWHGIQPWSPDFSEGSRVLAFQARYSDGTSHDIVYVAMNMYWEPLDFQLPFSEVGERWYLFADTSRLPPHDIAQPGNEQPLSTVNTLTVAARSVVIAVSRANGT